MEKTKLHDKFRKQLTNAHALTVFTILLLEIVGYAVLIYTGNEKLALSSQFLWFRMILPSGLNVIAHLSARAIVKTHSFPKRQKTTR